MTSEQIDTLAQMIANHLPGLVREKSDATGGPSKPKNIGLLYVEKADVKKIIVAALTDVPPLP